MNDPIEKAKEIIEEFKHFGPGPHKGSGTPQSVHAGFKKMGGAGVLQAVSGMERTQAREYVARLRAANPKKPAEEKLTVSRDTETLNPAQLTKVSSADGLYKPEGYEPVRISRWQKYGKDRVYLSSETGGRNAGYIDMDDGSLHEGFRGSWSWFISGLNAVITGSKYEPEYTPRKRQTFVGMTEV